MSEDRWETRETQAGVIHVLPIDDLRDHEAQDCWCEPHDDDGLIVHNSMDHREEFEPDYKFGSTRKMS